MGLTRISTVGGEIVIEIDGRQARVPQAVVDAKVRRVGQLESEIATRLGRAFGQPIFFHQNRSGTVDVYTGKIPDIFPEDAEKPV